MSSSLRVSSALRSFSVRGLSSLACDLECRFESGDANLAKLDTIRLNTSQSPRNDPRTVTIGGTCNLRMTSAMLFALSSVPGFIIWPSNSIWFGKRHTRSVLSVAPAS